MAGRFFTFSSPLSFLILIFHCLILFPYKFTSPFHCCFLPSTLNWTVHQLSSINICNNAVWCNKKEEEEENLALDAFSFISCVYLMPSMPSRFDFQLLSWLVIDQPLLLNRFQFFLLNRNCNQPLNYKQKFDSSSNILFLHLNYNPAFFPICTKAKALKATCATQKSFYSYILSHPFFDVKEHSTIANQKVKKNFVVPTHFLIHYYMTGCSLVDAAEVCIGEIRTHTCFQVFNFKKTYFKNTE